MFFFSVLPLPSSLPNPFPSITRGWAHFSNQWMSWSSPALICWFVSSTTGWANSDFISANFPNLSPVGGRDPFQYSPCDSDSASRFRNPLNFPPRIIRDDSASTRPYSYTQSILTRLIQHLLDVWISRKQSSASSARNQFIWLIVKLDATAWGGGKGWSRRKDWADQLRVAAVFVLVINICPIWRVWQLVTVTLWIGL